MALEVTPRLASRTPVASPAETRFRRLVDFLRGTKRPLIQLQHNPDPDALASGFALKHLIKRVLHLDPVVTFTGSVGRAENRAMMRYLKIRIIPAFKVRYAHHDVVIVVDTQPGAGTCRLPEGVEADVVVDHHPGGRSKRKVPLSLIEPGYGATSTIVGEMLLVNGLTVPRDVATALAYGIQTDTLDLARNVSPADERVYATLHALADKKVLGRIQRARVPQEYFRALERGLRRAVVHDRAVSTHLGAVAHPDIVAEVADLLFRLEGITWSFVTGAHARVLYASLRCIEAEGNDAGDVARRIAAPRGSGGGHEALAAAQIPIGAHDDAGRAHDEALERFLDAIRAKKSIRRPLTLPPEATQETQVTQETQETTGGTPPAAPDAPPEPRPPEKPTEHPPSRPQGRGANRPSNR